MAGGHHQERDVVKELRQSKEAYRRQQWQD